MAKNDKVYEAYMGEMGENFQRMTKKRIEWITNLCGDAKSVLDIGCSQGIISLLLAEKGKKVVGVDCEEEAILFANDLLQNKYHAIQESVRFICSDFMNLDMKEKFDCILITEVIEHLDNPEDLLKKAGTFLTDGGKMVVSVPFGVCPHPDHKATYYLSNFLRLLQNDFSVVSVQFLEQWMCAVCDRKRKNDFLFENFYEEQENKFKEKEYWYLDRIEQLQESLQSTNQKYRIAAQNYETAKGWLERKEEKLQQAKMEMEIRDRQLENSNKKYQMMFDNYEELQKNSKAQMEKMQKLEKENSDYQQYIESIKGKNDLMIEHLSDCVKDYDLSIINAEQLLRELNRLEIQNSALVQKNGEYKRQLDIITNSRIGRLGVKMYGVYKRYFKK